MIVVTTITAAILKVWFFRDVRIRMHQITGLPVLSGVYKTGYSIPSWLDLPAMVPLATRIGLRP